MPTFQYKAKTRGGELVSGSLAAGDRRAALAESESRIQAFRAALATLSDATQNGQAPAAAGLRRLAASVTQS